MISYSNTNQFLAIALPSINVLLLSALLWQTNTPDDTQVVSKRMNELELRLTNSNQYTEQRHNVLAAQVADGFSQLEGRQRIIEARQTQR